MLETAEKHFDDKSPLTEENWSSREKWEILNKSVI